MTPATIASKTLSMNEIKDKAKSLGVNPGTMKKTELIRAIQAAEHNNTCYGTSKGTCQWTACCWRTDCLKIKS